VVAETARKLRPLHLLLLLGLLIQAVVAVVVLRLLLAPRAALALSLLSTKK
jgi:hypothetical protein